MSFRRIRRVLFGVVDAVAAGIRRWRWRLRGSRSCDGRASSGGGAAGDSDGRRRCEPERIVSSWDDLLDGVRTVGDWKRHKEVLRGRYLELIRAEAEPAKPSIEIEIHESVTVEGVYVRHLISYNVEADERAHAYLGVPLERDGRLAGVVALHGTLENGKDRVAGLIENPDKAYLDHLARRGYVVIAPDHFVTGHRVPPEGHYDTSRFYKKHPNWTAVGKSTYDSARAVDVLGGLEEVDPERIGVLGHSLGGHGSCFLAAYDERVKVAACNCGALSFRHNPRVEDWARAHWYVYFRHIRSALLAGDLPAIDMHEIMSLIAPRALLDIAALNDANGLTQRQRMIMNAKVMEVYELEKASERFAFYLHGQGHTVPHDSRMLMYAWLDKHLKPQRSTATQRVVGS